MIIEIEDIINYLRNCNVDEIVEIITSSTSSYYKDEEIARALAKTVDYVLVEDKETEGGE